MWNPMSTLPLGLRQGRVPNVWGVLGCCRLYSQSSVKPPKTPIKNSSATLTPQADKQRRKLKREKAILSKDVETEEVKWTPKEKIVYSASTTPGWKKDTSVPLPQAYSPEFVESCWYQWWEKEGFFTPEHHRKLPHAVKQTFSLCIPPPNVTGSLHLGHALTVAIEDSLSRWRRMQGYKVLWVPGCDHAGIATQSVVERSLLRKYGKHRQEYSRDEFLQEVWNWKNDKGVEIYEQLRKLGASLDWTRTCFTMDPGFSSAVTEAFVRLSDSGLIYRSEALVNWSCALESTISDIEVDSKQLTGRTLLSVPGYDRQVEFGSIVTFAYPVEGHETELCVSTTRPETMLGDVAVAVHPDDPRYTELHGKHCRHPFMDRLLPIIPDPSVEMHFGTGAVKITPAHDHNDFQLGKRHDLPRLTVIGGDGLMTALCGKWLEGVKRFDARVRVLDALTEKKLLRGSKEHAMALPICSRSGDVIEPLLKRQWFVSCEEMARKAIQGVEEGQLEILPPVYTKIWKNWLSNISDWCISRQLWWGHQIPAYRVSLPHTNTEEEERWVWGQSEDEALERAAAKFGVTMSEITLTRDTDVLDTWFSSALFPFAMLGWPQQTADLEQFYPNSILETGSDLIFFWVARMVMLGTELTGQLPFKQVLLHSLIRDKYGRKMSKSLGNVIDPLDVIHGITLQRLQEKVTEGNLDPRESTVAMEAQRKDFPQGIPECGTDALRFALCSYRTQGEDVSMSVSHVLSCRHFCNKMWQTVRFTLGVLQHSSEPITPLDQISPVTHMDRWICSRMLSTVRKCEEGFHSYELHAVTATLHSFWLHSLCDVYLECIKPMLSPQATENNESREHAGSLTETERRAAADAARSLLYHCVCLSLTLLNPIMPFITEELWQRLHLHDPRADVKHATSLCVQPYPHHSQLTGWDFPQEEADFELAQEVIRVARLLRAQCHMTKEKAQLWVVCTPAQCQTLLPFSGPIETLGRISGLHFHCPPQEGDIAMSTSAPPPPEGCTVGVVDNTCHLHLDVQQHVAVDKQVASLLERKGRLGRKLDHLIGRTAMPGFLEKVPEHVRLDMEQRITALKQELNNIEEQVQALEQIKQSKQ
ncbi:valine--tRNA ligase, mitochondrial [Engraulis encrasicolus]|uniref:valine--tRNA ligase, mitochondrial n=1 Tax=Engraulis encrasicolus TaxID=184585 RepID=UPI002FD39986